MSKLSSDEAVPEKSRESALSTASRAGPCRDGSASTAARPLHPGTASCTEVDGPTCSISDCRLLREQTRAMTSDVDRYGRAALHYAVLDARTDEVEQLLNGGADPNVAGKAGQTPLHFAAQEYRPAEAALLCSVGAVVDARDKHGNSPLFRATFASRGRADVITILLANGANADLPNNSGVTPRQLAQRIANSDVLHCFGV